MSSLYSHITLGRVLSVKQRLNGSPFYRETPLKKEGKMQGVGVKSANAPNGENSVTKVLENYTEFTELVFFLCSHSGVAYSAT